MKILITGATGFLGKIIIEKLGLNNEIYSLARTQSFYNIDIVKEFTIKNQNFDFVIHAAGKAHSIPTSSQEKQAFFDVNYKGTQNLLKGLEMCQYLPKSFVFISSVAVYGIESGVNISEDIPLSAKNPYGLSKIQAEELVLEWCKQHNVICTILRLPLLAGFNPPGNLGAMIKGIKKGYYFNIASGKAKRSMVLAEDVAKAILQVAKIGGIYNLTDCHHPSFAELSKYISIQMGKNQPLNLPIGLATWIAKVGDLFGNKSPITTYKLNKITSDLTFDDTKARKAFGWNPTPVLEGFKIHNNAQ